MMKESYLSELLTAKPEINQLIIICLQMQSFYIL